SRSRSAQPAPAAVIAPPQTGYGTRCIRSLIPYELGGTVDLVFDPAGVRCGIDVPSKRHDSSEAVPLFKTFESNPSADQNLLAESHEAAASASTDQGQSRGWDVS